MVKWRKKTKLKNRRHVSNLDNENQAGTYDNLIKVEKRRLTGKNYPERLRELKELEHELRAGGVLRQESDNRNRCPCLPWILPNIQLHLEK